MSLTIDRPMIVVMGLTGAGKSYFINQLLGTTGPSVAEGKKLTACTSKCEAIAACVGNTELVIVDCPGFDDTYRTDTEILKEITDMLTILHMIHLKLKGVVYLHRVTDNRMQGSAMKNLKLFMKLVGQNQLSNVVFVTTMWNKLQGTSNEEANDHDFELRDKFWGEFLRKGASATRFDGSQASVEGILAQLLGKKDVVLEVQHQIVELGLSLKETTAGAFLEPVVHEQQADFQAKIQELEQELEVEEDSNRRIEFKRSKRKAEEGEAKSKQDLKTLQSKPGKR